jgi:transcriptional regulator with XRE-family HTH domain
MSHRLKKLREAAGMTQASLAAAAGVSVRSYQQWELGVRTPLFDAAARIARALGVSLDELAGTEAEAPRRRKGKGA